MCSKEMFETLERWRTAQEAERGWWSRYKVQKKQVDLHVKYYKNAVSLMAEIENYKENDITSDAGCGPGNFLNLIHSGFKIGLDPLFPYFVRQGVVNRTFQVVQALSESMPFKPEACTKVFCYNVIDHVVNTEGTLTEIRRVMRNDGLLLALEVHSPITKLRRVIMERVGIGRDIHHPHSFTTKDVNKMLDKLGFQIIHIQVLFSAKSPSTIMRFIESLFGMASHYFLCIILKKIPKRETTNEIA